MTVRLALRAVALGIALAGAWDPAVTWERPRQQRVTIAALGERAHVYAERLQERWRDHDDRYSVAIRQVNAAGRAAACPATGGCLVVTEGEAPRRLTAGAAVIGAVRLREREGGSAIAALEAPVRVSLEQAAEIRLTLARPVDRVEVRDAGAGAIVGPIDGPGQQQRFEPGAITARWIPLRPGARRLRIIAGGRAVDTGVIVEASRLPVVMYEPAPSWIGTFVRRALEHDPRLVLSSRTEVAPSVAVTHGEAVDITADELDRAAAVIITTPGALRAPAVNRLERYVALRGGSLIVLPDQRPSGPLARLLPPVLEERREPAPVEIGPLRAREVLIFERDQARGLLSLSTAEAADEVVVAARPIGRGRVIVSGVLDAWRYRGSGARFDGFWADLVADAARAAGPALRVTPSRVLLTPGDEIEIEAAYQASQWPSSLAAHGEIACDDGSSQPVRLWPGRRPGMFSAAVVAEHEGECRVTIHVAGDRADAPLLVASDVQRPPDRRLDALITAYGGVVAEEGEEDRLTEALARRSPPDREHRAVYPMRSPLWIVPFVLALGGEWWMRRRGGLR